MLFSRPDDDTLYAALLARDPAWDGHAYVCVKTTGIFCRLTCPARKPKRKNSSFHSTVSDCLESGYRPCKRCRPLSGFGEMAPLVAKLVDALENTPDRRWSEADISALGHDPSTVRRTFKRHFGITFLEMARLRRLGRATSHITDGGRIIDAQIDAGFESGSGFRNAVKRMLNAAPAELRDRELLRADWIETPLGPLIAIADKTCLCLLEFLDRKALARELKTLRKATGSAIEFGRFAPIDQAEAQLKRYFAGEPNRFNLELSRHGTKFERQVWHALCEIPIGETRSYGQIASKIDHPTASRAVARANGANRLAILIPCHRVIGADGSLTGYGGGIWRKRWLIEHERQIAEKTHANRKKQA
jgi:AraC family transcriptional regulator of adaptative response/methylated-DNA-[protein]-cysteine methyltransferase